MARKLGIKAVRKKMSEDIALCFALAYFDGAQWLGGIHGCYNRVLRGVAFTSTNVDNDTIRP